jgi:hypothetical protein
MFAYRSVEANSFADLHRQEYNPAMSLKLTFSKVAILSFSRKPESGTVKIILRRMRR